MNDLQRLGGALLVDPRRRDRLAREGREEVAGVRGAVFTFGGAFSAARRCRKSALRCAGASTSGVVAGNSVYQNNGTGLSVVGDFVVSKNTAHANGTNYSLAGAPNAAPVSTLAAAGPWNNVGQ